MATSICVCSDAFELDADGRLCLKAGCGLVLTADGLATDVTSIRGGPINGPAGGGGFDVPINAFVQQRTHDFDIVNPSKCKSMNVNIEWMTTVAITNLNPENGYEILEQNTISNATLYSTTERYATGFTPDGARTLDITHRFGQHTMLTIPPGGTQNFFIDIEINSHQKNAVLAAPPGLVHLVATRLNYLGVIA